MSFSDLYNTDEWQATRWRIIRRDKGACTVCGFEHDLQVHHEKYVGNHPSDTPDQYLKTLCRNCHRRAHNLAVTPFKEPRGFESLRSIIPQVYSRIVVLSDEGAP